MRRSVPVRMRMMKKPWKLPVSGRVKLIYAQTGDDTADVMLENGALISGTQVTGTAAFLWKDIFRTLR